MDIYILIRINFTINDLVCFVCLCLWFLLPSSLCESTVFVASLVSLMCMSDSESYYSDNNASDLYYIVIPQMTNENNNTSFAGQIHTKYIKYI